MKKTTQILSILLTVAMVISAIPLTVSAAAIHHEDNFDWILAGSTLTIMPREGAACVYDDDTSIYPYTNQIETVVIEEGIKEIMPGAFRGYNHIEKAVIPSTCKSLIYEAFHDCTALTDVVIANGVEKIESEAFEGCTALEEIEIPGSVKTLEASAFYACTALREVFLSEGLQTIGEEAFCNCPNLHGVVLPASIKSIEDYAFGYAFNGAYNKVSAFTVAGCGTGGAAKNYADSFGIDYYNLYHIEEGSDTLDFNEATGLLKINFNSEKTKGINDSTFSIYKNKIEAVELEGNINSITNFTFANCPNLRSVKLNNSLETISKFAFTNCPQLKKIAVPSSVKSIGMFALGFEWNESEEEYVGVNGFGIASTCDNAAVKDYINKAKTEQGVTIEWYKTHNLKARVVKPTATTLGYTSHACPCGQIDNRDTFVAPTGKVAGFKCAARTQAAEKFVWNKVSGVSGYQIQISNAAGNAWGKAYATKANYYLFKGLTAGANYKFRIRTYIKAADGKNYFGPWVAIASPALPASTVLTKLTAGNKSFTAQWGRKAVTGYQIQYGTKANFAGAKTLTVKNAKAYKYAVKSLKAKTYYYVRIRTYKTISKANYFSTWSKTYKVKTK